MLTLRRRLARLLDRHHATECVVVTVHDEAEAFVRQAEYRREFIVTQTVFLSLLPLLYSTAIFVWGDRLWRAGMAEPTVYATALDLPNAPESWGVFFALCGFGCLISLFTHHDRALAGISALSALILASFMVAFVSDFVRYDTPLAIPGSIVYCILSLSFFNLARLAWVSSLNRAPKVKP